MGGRGGSGAKGSRYTGDVRYRVRSAPGGGGSVTAYQNYKIFGPLEGTREVGSLTWDASGKVHDIEVRADRQRMGIGIGLWRQAQQATGGQISHSENRTGAGEAWARAVGGETPPRSDWQPGAGS